MSAPLDLTGQRFGWLTAVRLAGSSKDGKRLWRCRCACGKETVVKTHRLRGGDTTSCGCRLEDWRRRHYAKEAGPARNSRVVEPGAHGFWVGAGGDVDDIEVAD